MTTAVFFLGAAHADTLVDMEAIAERIRSEEHSNAPSASEITAWVEALASDGSWPDIDYSSTSPTEWQPREHGERMLDLARAFRAPEHPGFGDSGILQAIHRALAYWFAEDPLSSNWWYNDISTPRLVGRTMLLLDDECTPQELEDARVILERPGFSRTGQNLVDESANLAVRALIYSNTLLFAEALSHIRSELRQTSAEGIQYDYSFHQHGPQLYTAGYGELFAQDQAYWADISRETSFGLTQDQVAHLVKYWLEGVRWVTWGNQWTFCVTGRSLSRGVPQAGWMATGALRMAEVSPAFAAEFQDYADSLSGTSGLGGTLVGNKHFWCSDHMVHRRPSWMMTVRMCSTRVQGSEAGNGEGLKNYYMGDGTTYLLRDGLEYQEIQPLWNWRRLPGVTCPQKSGDLPVLGWDGYHNGSAFVGGASDGELGVATMHLVRGGLNARKGWFMFPDMMVALGSDIDYSSSADPVFTTLNQCNWRGAAFAGSSSTAQELGRGMHQVQNSDWVYHDHTGYLNLDTAEWSLELKEQSGSWYEINSNQSDEIISSDVFTLYRDHGEYPANDSYAYAVLPDAEIDAVLAAADSFPIEILANSSSLQALWRSEDETLMAIFYSEGSLDLPGGGRLTVDRPCVLILRSNGSGESTLVVSDPQQGGGDIAVEISGRYAGSGTSWDAGRDISEITMSLPSGNYAGSGAESILQRVEETSIPSINIDYGADAYPWSADLHVDLTAGGVADIYALWGDSPSGTIPSDWDKMSAPIESIGGRATISLPDLQPGREYYYSIMASNSFGTVWSEPVLLKTGDAISVPPEIGDCVLWLDASDPYGDGLPPSSGSVVGSWVDLSGNGNDFSAWGEPAWNMEAFNGKPGIVFDGADDAFTGGDLQIHDNYYGLTIIVVCHSTGNSQEGIIAKNTWANNAREWVIHSSDYQVQEDSTQRDLDCSVDFDPSSAPALLCARWLPELESSIYRNGELIGLTAKAAKDLDDTPSQLTIAVSNEGLDATRYFDGVIAEVICFRRALSAEEIDQLGAYLSAKYQISTAYPLMQLADADADLLDDEWEREHFGGTGLTSGSDDYDGDGYRNFMEMRAGTDPDDANSLLAFSRIYAGEAFDVIFEWPSVSNRTYAISTSSDPASDSWTRLKSGLQSTPPSNTASVSLPDLGSARVYRIEVENE